MARFPFFFCKRPGGKSVAAEFRLPFKILENTDSEVQGRVNFLTERDPSIGEKIRHVYHSIRDGTLTPEVLHRIYPESFGRGFKILRDGHQPFRRDIRRYSHSLLEDMSAAGIKRGTPRDSALNLLLLNVKKDLFIGGDKGHGRSIAEIRRTMDDFIHDRIPFSDLLMSNQYRDMTPESIGSLRNAVEWIDATLSDRDIDVFARSMARSMNYSRELSRTNLRRKWLAEGISDAKTIVVEVRHQEFHKVSEIDLRLDEALGPDLDAYIPALRFNLHTTATDLKEGRYTAEMAGVFTHEIEDFDTAFGTHNLDDELSEAIIALARFVHAPKPTPGLAPVAPFEFPNAAKLGLPVGQLYADVDDAIMDLFRLQRPRTGPKSPADDLISHVRGRLKRIADNPSPSLVASLSAVPSEIRNRFYQRRVLSQLPLRGSAVEAFSAYMNASLKFAYIQPIIDDLAKIARDTKHRDVYEGDLFIHWVSDVLGGPRRASRGAMRAINRVTSAIYMSTLGSNLSPVIGNLLGQMGFILSEFGPLATITGVRAIAQKTGRYSPIFDHLERLGIGMESSPANHAKMREAWALFRSSETGDEAMRRLLRLGLSAIDIFTGSESLLRKVSYVAGMTDHLMKSGVYRPGMTQEQLVSALDAALKLDTNAIRSAGEEGSARGAFLFGNENNPAFIRWLRDDPTGLASLAGMFSNYPIQAFSRVAMWSHDALRLTTHGRRDAAGLAGLRKLFTFFTYGSAVAGPFFLLPVLRDMLGSTGDDTSTARVKNFFVAWEKNFSVAGLMGHAVKQVTGEYATIDLSTKIGVTPTLYEPLGILGNLFGGPAIQTVGVLGRATGIIPGAEEEQSKARQAIIGGHLEHKISGLGDLSRPIPMTTALFVPNGITAARILNAYFTLETTAGTRDEMGRLINRPSFLTEAIIRHFGRPLGEVLTASEGRIANEEVERHSRTVTRLKRAFLDGNSALAGELLTSDPSLFKSVEPSDLTRLLRDRNLVPQARSALYGPIAHARVMLERTARRLSGGNLTPAEEFTARQVFAVLVARFRAERAREAGTFTLPRTPSAP